jgi:hypothetical protein
MRLSHDGLTLWFSTPDAPAPVDDEVVPRAGVSLVIGAHPYNPTSSISVRYRIDAGLAHTVPGHEIRIDHAGDIQYFAVTFPRFVTGSFVEYAPTLVCGGRQVPAAQRGERYLARFRLEPAHTPSYARS